MENKGAMPPELKRMFEQMGIRIDVIGMPMPKKPIMITLPTEIREEFVCFFETFKELIPDNEEQIKEVLEKMKEDLSSEDETNADLLGNAKRTIMDIAGYLSQNKGSADIDDLKTLLTEYVKQDDPTQILLAKEMLNDISLSDELNKVIRNWNEIMDSVAALVPCECDECSKTCGSSHQ